MAWYASRIIEIVRNIVCFCCYTVLSSTISMSVFPLDYALMNRRLIERQSRNAKKKTNKQIIKCRTTGSCCAFSATYVGNIDNCQILYAVRCFILKPSYGYVWKIWYRHQLLRRYSCMIAFETMACDLIIITTIA